jgi:hypothetical protein
MHHAASGSIGLDVTGLLAHLALVAIVLWDGFRPSDYPKMEVVPSRQDRPLLASSGALWWLSHPKRP